MTLEKTFDHRVNDWGPCAVVTGDLRVTEHLFPDRPQLSSDVENAVCKLNDIAGAKRLPIVAAGNIFHDKYPLPHDLSILRYGVTVPFYYVLGAHDYLEGYRADYPALVCHTAQSLDNQDKPLFPQVEKYPNWDGWEAYDEWNELIDSCYPVKSGQRYTPVINGVCHCFSKEDLGKGIDRVYAWRSPHTHTCFDVLVMSQKCAGITDDVSPELVDGLLPNGRILVICGSNTVSKVTTIKSVSGQSIPVLAPGSICPVSINDTSTKYVHVLCAEGYMVRQKLPSREVITWDMTDCKNIDACTELLRGALHTLLRRTQIDLMTDSLIHIRYPDRFKEWIELVAKPLIYSVENRAAQQYFIEEGVFFTSVPSTDG
jgi:hypothetical protein